jgi:hypothetical protein
LLSRNVLLYRFSTSVSNAGIGIGSFRSPLQKADPRGSAFLLVFCTSAEAAISKHPKEGRNE